MQTNSENTDQVAKKIWETPWKYKESLLINLALLITGFALEFVLWEYKITLPSWPVNLYIIIVFIIILGISSKFFNKNITNFLSGIPAAITSISTVMFLVLLMGLIPQYRQEGWIQNAGLTHLKNSWPYLFSAFYLLIVLGHALFRRMNNFSFKNIGFFLNHAGLWILIATASLGAADLKKYDMKLVLDRAIYFADDDNGVTHQIPFAIKLLEFDIEEYPPSLGIIETATSKIVTRKGDKLFEIIKGTKFGWEGWQIEIIDYIPEARIKDGVYEKSTTMGAIPAVKLRAINSSKNIEQIGWVSSGNFVYQTQMLPLDENLSIAMTVPQPKKFSSQVRIFKTTQEYQDAEIIVNKPVRAYGYKIYQVGYDESMGKWSKISSIQLVRDPWLPAVYVGIFMILAGSLYLALTGKSKTTKH